MEKILRQALKNGTFTGVSNKRSQIMGSVRGKGNKTTEKRLRAALIRNGIKGWRVNPKSMVGNPDFFFPSQRIAVFVDGCFWHACIRCGHVPKNNHSFWSLKLDNNRKRDRRIDRELRAQGIRVIRLWEHQLKSELHASVKEIESYL